MAGPGTVREGHLKGDKMTGEREGTGEERAAVWIVCSGVALPNPVGRAGSEQAREAARDREEVGASEGKEVPEAVLGIQTRMPTPSSLSAV